MSTYPTIKLRDGSVVPGVAYGVGTALYRQECAEEVKGALAAGFRHLDLAEVYETSGSAGKAIKESGIPREELYITTKAGAGMKDVKKAIDEELEKIGTDHVSLFLLHWAHDFRKPGFPSMEEAWKAMIEVKESGKAKNIGVSNFRQRDLQKIIDSSPKELPAINQIEYHPFLYKELEEVERFCREHGIAIAAYSPLAPITQFKGVSSDFDQALEEVTQAVSERAGETVTSSQVLLRLASQRQALVVTTSRNKKRTADALKAGGLPELTEEEQNKLLKAAEDAGSHRAFQEHMGELDVEY